MSRNQEDTDVLIADDDRDDLYIFELAINQISIAISLRQATDGDMLFEKLKEAIPDLLFLDIAMPCKNGISCLLEIRKDARYNNMPVIMFTSHHRQSYIKTSYQNGANFFLLKPNSLTDLVEKLRFVFSKQANGQLYFPPIKEYVLAS